MKYLVIAALAILVSIVVYSRLRPYVKIIRKVVNFLNESTGSAVVDATAKPTASSKAKRELLRCEACGTWIPADRALKLSSGLANYCSRECLEKNAGIKEHRAAS